MMLRATLTEFDTSVPVLSSSSWITERGLFLLLSLPKFWLPLIVCLKNSGGVAGDRSIITFGLLEVGTGGGGKEAY